MRTLIVVTALACAQNAWACGGVFCSGGPAAAPVDQRAERILFEVYGERICTTVQVLYEGTPQSFAWVVPVPSTPEVGEGSTALLERLEEASRPRFVLPPDGCASAAAFDSEAGASCDSGCQGLDDFNVRTPAELAAALPVEVFGQQSTESYETATIGAEDANDVVRWLQLGGYQISANMVPALQPYADQGMKFLGVMLKANAAADSVQPLRFCYDAAYPAVPLQLTAVAARPQMAVQVMVVSDMHFTSLDPPATPPIPEELHVDAAGRVDYHAWVGRSAAAAAGRFIVDEFRGKNPLPDGELAHCDTCGFDRPLPLLSRFYLRLNAEHMTWDPAFVPTEATPNEGVVNLSGHPPVTDCDGQPLPEAAPPACAWLTCGEGAECVEDPLDGRAGCDCASYQVATAFTDLEGERQPSCVPRQNPVGIPTQPGLHECGAGEPFMRAGFPACDCDEDAVARISAGAIRCVVINDPIIFDPVVDAERLRRAFRPLVRPIGVNSFLFIGLLLLGWFRRRR